MAFKRIEMIVKLPAIWWMNSCTHWCQTNREKNTLLHFMWVTLIKRTVSLPTPTDEFLSAHGHASLSFALFLFLLFDVATISSYCVCVYFFQALTWYTNEKKTIRSSLWRSSIDSENQFKMAMYINLILVLLSLTATWFPLQPDFNLDAWMLALER